MANRLPDIERTRLPTVPTLASWRLGLDTDWILAPLLPVYALLVLAGRSLILQGDATRYIAYATNLLHGSYALPGTLQLWNGPGYPLVLLPFTPFSAWLPAALLNVVFLFGAVLYFYASLRSYVAPRLARLGALALGLYPPALVYLMHLFTETLALLLVAGLIYHGSRLLRQPRFSWRQAALAAFFMGYLALTKILFGYVVEAALVLAALVWLIWRRALLRRAALVCGLALLLAAPYLVYTYTVVGRLNFWGDSGGKSLYWMSTPYAGELGDWFTSTDLDLHPELAKNHRAFFDQIAPLSSLQQDDAFKRRAIVNISQHPFKYAQNWVANVARIFFDFPYSYTTQRLTTFVHLIPSIFIVAAGTAVLALLWRDWRLLPPEQYAMLVFAGVALGGSSLLSAYGRMLVPLVPILGLSIIIVLSRGVRLADRRGPAAAEAPTGPTI